jgi:hypothetical protein
MTTTVICLSIAATGSYTKGPAASPKWNPYINSLD